MELCSDSITVINSAKNTLTSIPTFLPTTARNSSRERIKKMYTNIGEKAEKV